MQDADIVYITLRKLVYALTFRLAKKAPLSQLLCLTFTVITAFFLCVAFVSILAIAISQDVSANTVDQLSL